MKRVAHAMLRAIFRQGAKCVLPGLGMLCVVPSIQAAEPRSDDGPCRPTQTVHWRGGTLRFENDLFAGTDRNYTNGVAIALASHDLEGRLRPDCLPGPLRLYARFLGRFDPDFRNNAGAAQATQNVVLRFGQAMYTPEDRTRTDVIPDDRPYAGLLYLGMAWNRRFLPGDSRYEILDTRELTLGVIGPLSLAEQSQNLVHDLRGIDRFNGWGHQLHNEPAFELALERRFKPYRGNGAVQPGWGSDAIGSYALRLGNIETAARAGFELRAGWNIPNDFGSYPIRPGAENRSPSAAARLPDTHPRPRWAPQPGVHAFANVEAKAVAWDFSLDGNLFGNSHRVTRVPWVVQATAGISSQWLVRGHGVKLELMRVWRTREFEQQRGNHAFGSVALSVEF
ncbi:hypothetical protein GALL_336290 [mine drainage metagenome]|uniref:Lipid A deacylase LpxR family protein n=1 Tax=mine drainage metagenome TaxID=410659 RepID=A0A1J5QLZ8_9ZZZZ